MAKTFSDSWKASVKPDKQRKYTYNAPLHIRGKMMASHLTKDLQKKHEMRSIRIRKNDKVKIMRGQFKGKNGKVERVDLKNYRVYVDKAEIVKKDGTKALYPIHPSNLMITELDTTDKKRLKSKVE